MPRISLARLGERLRSAEGVLLAVHEQPDADALGSVLALAAGLRNAGQTVTIGCADPVPERYRFLPGWREIRRRVSPAPLALVLDLNDPRRLNTLEKPVRASGEVLVLDHHPGAPDWNVPRHIRPDAAASALLVYRLLRVMRLPLTPEMATCLLCGLGGDTGFFTFQNTSAEALEVAGRLVAAGANAYQVHRLSVAMLPLTALRLRGIALSSVREAQQGRLVYAVLRLADFTASGAAEEEPEGIVDLLKVAAGGEVFVLFKQAGEADWRVSFRSDQLDVGSVARALGGGGHAVAAGCSVPGTEKAVVRLVLGKLKELWP